MWGNISVKQGKWVFMDDVPSACRRRHSPNRRMNQVFTNCVRIA
jgi:hypothetical protein